MLQMSAQEAGLDVTESYCCRSLYDVHGEGACIMHVYYEQSPALNTSSF